MWGIRIIIPESLQSQVLKSLHESHPGISNMKAIAHSYFWWNGLDKDIENLGKSCQTCQAVQSHPAAAPLHPWVWPDTPWKQGYVTLKQAQQKQYHDKHAKSHFFFPGTPVMVRNFQEPNKWIPGIILQKLGPVTYRVEIANGQILKQHIEHLILRRESSSVSTAPDTTQLDSAVCDNYQFTTIPKMKLPQHSWTNGSLNSLLYTTTLSNTAIHQNV